MTTSIGVSNSGTVFFSGVASDLDTQSLITNAVNAKLLVKQRYTTQISTNTAKITAFQTLQSQAQQLQISLDNLSRSTIGTTLNPFSGSQVTSTTSDGSNADGIVKATTSVGAQAGTYNVVVSQLAKAFSATGGIQTSSTAALGYSGTFDIGEDGKTAATITVTATTTLTDLRNQINASTATSGVKADILQQANGQYKLVIAGADTAKAVSIGNVTGDDVLTNLGMTDASHSFVNSVTAQQAKFTINDLPVTSDSNNVQNVLTGLSLNLNSAAPGTTVSLTVGNNTTGVATAIQDFVTKYNTLINTIAANKAVNSDGTVGSTSVLYGETTNSGLGSMLGQLTSGTYGSGGLNGLRALGITLDGNNNLVVDSAALTNALNSNYSSVQALFSSSDSTTGIADAMETQLKTYTSLSSGIIANEIKNLQSRDIDLQTKADAVQTAADAYQTQLINQYAQMEAKIKSADILKQQITAILTGSTPTK